MDTTTKSRGHVEFIGTYEYIEYNGELHRAPLDCVIATNGYRLGMRFECYAHMQDVCLNTARELFEKFG